MSIIWHRVNETVEVDLSNAEGGYSLRPYYYEIPVLREDLSRYLDYDPNDILAISLVIARRHGEDNYPELLAKRSFWMIKNLCERTDANEEGVAIQLSIDNTLKELAVPYAEACRFPLDRINWFQSKESEGNDNICKFEAMFDDVFRDKERVLHMDLGLHFGAHQRQRLLLLFQRIKSFWQGEYMALMHLLLQVNLPWMKARPRSLEPKIWGLRPESKHEMAAYIGHSVEEEERYWHDPEVFYRMSGKIFGIHRDLRNCPAFRKEILELAQMGMDDETAITCYTRKHGWTESDIFNIQKFLRWTEGMNEPGNYRECSIIPAYPKGYPGISYAKFRRFWLSQHINNENLLCKS